MYKYHDKEAILQSRLRIAYGNVQAAMNGLRDCIQRYSACRAVTPEAQAKLTERIAVYTDILTDLETQTVL